MKDAHPGLFHAYRKTGVLAVVNGAVMIALPSRMPEWMPPPMMGTLGIVVGIGVLAGAYAPVKLADFGAEDFVPPPSHPLLAVGRAALGVLMFLYLMVAVGLLLGYDPHPPLGATVAAVRAKGIVTSSADRIILHLWVAWRSLDPFREPPSNPVTAGVKAHAPRHRHDSLVPRRHRQTLLQRWIGGDDSWER